MDPTNPQWGWSWLERWTGARPWESQSVSEKELKTDQMSVRSMSITGGEIAKSFARHQLNSELPSFPSSQKPSHPSGYHSPTTPSKPATSVAAARKLKPASPRVSAMNQDEDTQSMQSEQNRRHSIAGSFIRDDESLASSPSVPSYMASTQSAKAKARLQSPLGMENGTPEKGSAGPVKKRLSYPSSPARPRRHSGPPKFDNTSITKDHVNGVVN